MAQLFVLYESATGYALFEKLQSEEIVEQTDAFQQSLQDAGRFSRLVKMVSFVPFGSAENALANINDVSEGVLNDTLKGLLTTALPKKKGKFTLGVSEDKLGSAIQEELQIKCEKNTLTQELIRGIRLHFAALVKDVKEKDVAQAQLGLAHSYSRAKVKFNVHRVDNMIIQSINILDQLDKDLNTFSMRCREWYSWHFPELQRIITDHTTFATLCKFIQDKSQLTEEQLPELENITGDPDKAREILSAAMSSMGTDISEVDMVNIHSFADRVIDLSRYRTKLHEYLLKKMHDVAPNLSALIGEQVGARLISHAGSLTNLAKYPASTIQILGAEKALFRALKTKGNTPKYGLIFHSSFIGRADTKNKGRISRYLANKCSIASRIDSFTENSTSLFGEKLKEQVEERLTFYQTGATPRKNVDVMKEVLEEVKKEGLTVESKKRGAEEDNGSTRKKSKKEKKKKRAEQQQEEEQQPVKEEQPVEEMEVEATESKREKKKKKKRSQRE